MTELIVLLANQFPVVGGILAILGALMVVGQVIASITPSPKDDEFLEKIKKIPYLGKVLEVATSFAPIQKKVKSKEEK